VKAYVLSNTLLAVMFFVSLFLHQTETSAANGAQFPLDVTDEDVNPLETLGSTR